MNTNTNTNLNEVFDLDKETLDAVRDANASFAKARIAVKTAMQALRNIEADFGCEYEGCDDTVMGTLKQALQQLDNDRASLVEMITLTGE